MVFAQMDYLLLLSVSTVSGMDSRLLCLAAEQLGHPNCSLVLGNFRWCHWGLSGGLRVSRPESKDPHWHQRTCLVMFLDNKRRGKSCV